METNQVMINQIIERLSGKKRPPLGDAELEFLWQLGVSTLLEILEFARDIKERYGNIKTKIPKYGDNWIDGLVIELIEQGILEVNEDIPSYRLGVILSQIMGNVEGGIPNHHYVKFAGFIERLRRLGYPINISIVEGAYKLYKLLEEWYNNKGELRKLLEVKQIRKFISELKLGVTPNLDVEYITDGKVSKVNIGKLYSVCKHQNKLGIVLSELDTPIFTPKVKVSDYIYYIQKLFNKWSAVGGIKKQTVELYMQIMDKCIVSRLWLGVGDYAQLQQKILQTLENIKLLNTDINLKDLFVGFINQLNLNLELDLNLEGKVGGIPLNKLENNPYVVVLGHYYLMGKLDYTTNTPNFRELNELIRNNPQLENEYNKFLHRLGVSLHHFQNYIYKDIPKLWNDYIASKVGDTHPQLRQIWETKYRNKVNNFKDFVITSVNNLLPMKIHTLVSLWIRPTTAKKYFLIPSTLFDLNLPKTFFLIP